MSYSAQRGHGGEERRRRVRPGRGWGHGVTEEEVEEGDRERGGAEAHDEKDRQYEIHHLMNKAPVDDDYYHCNSNELYYDLLLLQSDIDIEVS